MKPRILYTAILVIGMMVRAEAQTDLQNNGTLYISGSSDILYISGSFTNASSAALTNNGQLHVKQTLSNAQSSMTVGTGTLYLSGTAAQAINGTQPFKTFDLVTNNSAGFTLNNDLSVSGTHTFTAGVIGSSATPNYLIYEAGSSYSGDGDAKHVSGWVKKNGTTTFLFPVGNGTVERKIGVSSLSASSSFNSKYAGATTNTGNMAAPLILVDPNEYWQLDQVSGGTAVVDMNWDNSKIAMPNYNLADIRVANYIAGNWTSVGGSASGAVATTGTISSNTLSTFGSFTFGSLSFLLPVELVQFGATRANGVTLITWTASNENNVGYYQVQRSDDGLNFYALGKVDAKNNSSLQEYDFTDSKALKGIAYYRLLSIDKDGRSKSSKVVSVSDRLVPGNNFAVINPVHGALSLTAGADHNGTYLYKINTTSGQTIQQGSIIITNGGSYSIPLASVVAKGVYVLEIRKKDFTFSQKVLVQ